MTTSRTEIYSSLRSRVLLKLTTDQVLVFAWIAGSCQVKAEPGCSMVVRKPVNSNPGLNQIITVSSIQMFFVYSFCFVYRFWPNNTENLTAKLQKSNQNSTLFWVSLIGLQELRF